MLQLVEKVSDRLLNLVVPKADAKAEQCWYGRRECRHYDPCKVWIWDDPLRLMYEFCCRDYDGQYCTWLTGDCC